MTLATKLKRLEDRLRKLPGLSVALSGGLDSSVLLVLACRILGPHRVEALTISSPIMVPEDLIEARLVALSHGVKHEFMAFDHLALWAFQANPPDRCYFCKKAMFEKLLSRCTFPLADGTQQDDLKEDRPGLKALKELKILSPLKEAFLTKEELRALGRKFGLRRYRETPSPCLATRFPPGERITAEKIARVREAEAYLLSLGFSRVRVRFLNDRALIEVDPREIELLWESKAEVIAHFKQLGFLKVCLDLQGYQPPLKRP